MAQTSQPNAVVLNTLQKACGLMMVLFNSRTGPRFNISRTWSQDAPYEVIDLVLKFREVDNPIVYDGILDIALQLPGEQSAKLKPKILEYARIDHQLWAHKYTHLLAHWTRHNQTSAALELSEILVDFAPDPQSEDKQKRRKKDPMDTNTLLEPSPRMKPSDYREIMLKRIRPLAEGKPYKVACILIDCHSQHDPFTKTSGRS